MITRRATNTNTFFNMFFYWLKFNKNNKIK